MRRCCCIQQYKNDEIKNKVDRLYSKLGKLDWTRSDCEIIAPITMEINKLKKEKNAVILGHSYQTPDIIFGVADYVGDSLGLSKQAAQAEAETIIFAGVQFMAETAKILSPKKSVILPNTEAGCSFAESITREHVKNLKEKYPGVPVVAYVNTFAEIKAEVDVCVTSANVLEIINDMDSEKIIFLPDHNMANFIRQETDKKIIGWDGSCVVHEEFQPEAIIEWKDRMVDLTVIAHSECPADVLEEVDMVGGTGDMQRYIEDNPDEKSFFLVTECGLSDRFAVEYPDRKFYGTCSLCPYMKKIQLSNILQSLKNPSPDQIIEVPDPIRESAKVSIEKMLEY